MTVYATFRHRNGAGASPAALLIAGSGPTDRNGNSPLEHGSVDTLETLAAWLSADGVASLRYDKLGTGQTGLGPYQDRIATIGPGVYQQEAGAALTFLASQAGVDRARLLVIGHSEGALYALLLATTHDPSTPPVAALGLLEPLARRQLDVLDQQAIVQIASSQHAGQLTADQAQKQLTQLAQTIAELRSSGTVPAGLPANLAVLFNQGSAHYLTQLDRVDPAVLAGQLHAHTPVLLSCSDADIQVSCADVDHLASGLTRADTAFVHLTGVDHILKEDPSRNATGYGRPLPFSTQLRTQLAGFLAEHRLR